MTIVLSVHWQVTGVSGFVGFHVVCEKVILFGVRVYSPVLYLQGLTHTGVVSAVRNHNVARVNKGYESFGDRFSTVFIDDLLTSDLLAAVEGANAIVRVASPLANTATPDVVLDVRTAITVTTCILDAALAAGVKKLVITGSNFSLASIADHWKDITISEQSHNHQTRLDALKPGAAALDRYAISKGLSDLALRNFKRDHPDMDIAFIDSTNYRLIYELIAGAPPSHPVRWYNPATDFPPLSVDVRDVARAHVLAFKFPPSPESPKRFLLSANRFTLIEAIELIAEKRPELKERLFVIMGKESPLGQYATMDTRKTESELGMKHYVKWQDTVLDTVDDLLRVEKERSGY